MLAALALWLGSSVKVEAATQGWAEHAGERTAMPAGGSLRYQAALQQGE
eukprot:CAMPEP_0113877998 /NCGR_PEP_ID=MMETSP0780_2-20120614/6422_1 /TAXON_ID=652834 /ORGANISM="Palpitomonas bilix" /LENGTH=48 /DNA_ID=CAMNT_0000864387 /DNA_START=117 /DNA_END=264 /DNA_ORIENTATION=- /assembly_acc=CAM_ASM_000599